jgi:serine acetyltransferase
MFQSAMSMTAILLIDTLLLGAFLCLGIRDLFLIFALLVFAHIITCIIATRLLMVVFPIIEGEFPIGSPEIARWQAQAVVALMGSIYFYPLVPFFLKPFWYRLFGAKIDKGVNISGQILDCSLTVLKAGSGVGADAMILGHFTAGGMVKIGAVIVEENAMIGAKALVLPGVKIGAGATIGAMSLVPSGKIIPADETWVGIPARKLQKKDRAP